MSAIALLGVLELLHMFATVLLTAVVMVLWKRPETQYAATQVMLRTHEDAMVSLGKRVTAAIGRLDRSRRVDARATIPEDTAGFGEPDVDPELVAMLRLQSAPPAAPGVTR